MNRRGFLFGLGASIAVVTTPGVLMPVVPRLVTSLHDLLADEYGRLAHGADQTAVWYRRAVVTLDEPMHTGWLGVAFRRSLVTSLWVKAGGEYDQAIDAGNLHGPLFSQAIVASNRYDARNG